MKLLEVIVTSAEEACEAEDGGAGRLELVRDLQVEGLTPSISIVERVLATVTIPVRVMLRDSPSFVIGTASVARSLKDSVRILSGYPIEGLVLGFLKDEQIDLCTLQHLAGAGDKAITFHRALELVADPFESIEKLKSFAQVDRILLNGGAGSWAERRTYLERIQEKAAPEMVVIAGGGLTVEGLETLASSSLLNEFHTGSAVRDSDGHVRSSLVRRMVRLLGSSR